MKKLLMCFFLCATGLAAAAGNGCDKPKNDFDNLYCLDKIYMQADKDLNMSYGELARLLDDGGRKLLRTGQLAWIKNRNDSCSFSDQRGFFVNLECATNTTRDRLTFLNNRIQECRSSGCLNSKLSEQ